VDERDDWRAAASGADEGAGVAPDDGAGREASGEPHTALPPKVEAWRRRSVSGAILTGFAFGLKEVLEPERDEPAIVMQVSGQPVRDLPVEADLDELHPSESVVKVRRWLLEGLPTDEPPGPDVGPEDRPGS
jgi:hypothetical protein